MKMKKKILSFLLAAAVVLGAVVPASLAYAQEPGSGDGGAVDNSGVVTSKTVTANKDGSYTITMEAHTTGTVISSEKAVPVDVVLVLDQSGSMSDSFGNTNRQSAMKTAVTNFIDSVGEQYTAEADHRLALVEFDSNARILKDWTFANEQGVSSLKSTVNRLDEGGATNVGAGMQEAEALMNEDYDYNGENSERQKVVIVFTDGVPTTSNEFHIGVANTAIKSALNMKQNDVTVYSIGIFDDADPNQLYGSTYHSLGFFEVIEEPCTGEVGSIFNTSLTSDWLGDVSPKDIPAGNRFLNFLSSNFATADNIGLIGSDQEILGIGFFGYKITQNFERTDTGYYLTATDEAGLNDIFQTISDEISTPSIQLGPETVIRDVVTPYFNAPAKTADIKLYTASYNGTDFGPREPADGLSVDVTGNTVSVTGFDFNANFVSEEPRNNGFYGKKLIIEFTVTAKDQFLGGNNVPTNGTDSGVYADTGELVENFAVPTVNVPIKEVTVTATDKNVYLMADLTAEQLKAGATAKVGDVALDFSEDNYGLESWQNAFVDITVNVPADKTNLTADTTYTLNVAVSPKDEPATEGTPAEKKTGEATAKINVFRPEITWKDSQLNVGETADYQKQNFVSVEWKHDTVAYDEDKMVGKAPELVYEYAPQANAFTQETKVNVTVKIGGSDVTQYVTFAHENCTFDGCQFNPDECEFIVHIKSFDLTITKTGCEAIDENQSFIFTVTGSNGFTMQVVINGNGSKTIKGLPSGTYTVTEDTNWSWRYEPAAASQTVTAKDIQNGKATVNFANDRAEESDGTGTDWKWLNGSAYTENKFGIPPQ